MNETEKQVCKPSENEIKESVRFNEEIDNTSNKNNKINLKVEYEMVKSALKNMKKKVKIDIAALLMFSIIVFIIGYFNVGSIYSNLEMRIMGTISLYIILFVAALIIYFTYEHTESELHRKIVEYETKYIQEESNNDIFESSIKMSYKYLDQYYLQTREQAQKGFIITVIISVVGAFLIAIGIIAMFLGKTTPSYVTCGSGVITEFISAIFFYLYNKTISSMSNYHNKLVLSHNISIALKVSDSLSNEDKTKAKNIIINELLKDINIHLISSDTNNKRNNGKE